MMLKKTILLLSFLMVTNTFSALVEMRPDGSLVISGSIEKKDVGQIKKSLNSAKKIILSDLGSGEVDIYLPLALEIFKKKKTVEIQNGCIATCAYLFLAADKKIFNQGFLGVTESTGYYVDNWNKVQDQFQNPDKNASKEKLLKELKRLALLERKFLKDITMKEDLFLRLPKINENMGENAYAFLVVKPQTLSTTYKIKNIEGQMKVTSVLFGEDVEKNQGLFLVE